MAKQRAARNYNTLEVDIEQWVVATEDRLMRVVRGSLDDVMKATQLPRAKGGNMPVITGFLRASGRASKGGWPSGPNIRPSDAKPNQFQWDAEGATAVVISLQYGETFFFGWTAVYAGMQELYNGFLEAAMQNWQKIVNTNIEQLRRAESASPVLPGSIRFGRG